MRLEQIVLHGFKSFADRTEVTRPPRHHVHRRSRTAAASPTWPMRSGGRWASRVPRRCAARRWRTSSSTARPRASPSGWRRSRCSSAMMGASRCRGARWRWRGGSTGPGTASIFSTRSACRLRDIQDLFAGTGVNPKAYALMDQDRLNHVLTAKPWERRVFIEEAAGIARYKQQRGETQGSSMPPGRISSACAT